MRLPGTSDRVSRKSGVVRAASPEDATEALIGQTFLGKYRTTSYLGAGSNAQVFLAHPLDNPAARVVVKRVHEHVAANARFRQFFDGEVRSMARFTHPYAVRLLDASLDDPLGPCLVLEYIPGVTLETVMGHGRRFTVERVARLLGPLCHALAAAHDAGIVHRDLKPANLMVLDAGTPRESIRVMDFGFAGFTAKPHIQLAELTGHGPVFACGTPAYVSPEMVRGDAVDGRADLYAVGVMLFELLTGRLPFECHTQEDMVAAHVQDPPPRMHRIGCGDVSPAAEGVVQLALSKYPNERQQTARELCDQFARAVGYDLWAETAPAGWSPAQTPEEEFVECVVAATPDGPAPSALSDPFLLSDQFEGMLPERLAAAKLKGFIDDLGAVVVASEPGLIRVRLDLPPGWKEPAPEGQGSKLFGWFSAIRGPVIPKGKEPIEVDFRMEKLDANRTAVLVTFRPLKWHIPDNLRTWQGRCEGVYDVIRKYLMAAV